MNYEHTKFECIAYLSQHFVFEETLDIYLVWVLEEDRCKWHILVIWVLWVSL